jgi:hypothetical protein
MISDEKRAFKRIRYKFTVRYRKHGAPAAVWGSSLTENISIGGMFFTSLEKFGIGDLIDCKIEAGTAGECSFTARIVRCGEIGSHMVHAYGVAVEFVNDSGDSARRLKAII